MIFPGYPDGEQPPCITPEGTGSLGVCMVGEASGHNEAKDQLPFRPYAEAGSVLERALRLSTYDRPQFLITNCVWYQPPHDYLEGAPYEYEAISFCRPWNEELFRMRQPRCFLALGGIAMRELSGMSGHRQGILLTRGFPVKSRYEIPVIGTYHPSYLRRGAKDEDKDSGARVEGAAGRGMDLLGVLIHDIQMAVHVAKHGWQFEKESDVEYLERASLEDLANFYNDAANHPDLPISWDIETRDTIQAAEDESETVVSKWDEIYQIQFSLRKKQAIIMDWQDSEPFHKLVCAIAALPNIKLDFNGRRTDRPITKQFLKDKGFQLTIAGDQHDLMDMWHHCQPDLPKGLQHVASHYCPEIGPWKHLDLARPHFYGGRDVDVPQRIWAKLPGDLKKLGIWHAPGHPDLGGYYHHVYRLSTTLDKMSDRGIPINNTKRLEFGKWLDGQKAVMEAEIQAMVPPQILNVHPKEGYKRIPVDLKEALIRAEIHSDGAVSRGSITTMQVGKKTYVQRCFNEIDQLKLLDVPTYRWCELLPFNANSGQQLMAYIRFKREEEIRAYIAKGHTHDQAEKRAKYKIPHNRKEGKDTTGKRDILALGKRTGDVIFSRVVQFREFGKLKGTYVVGWAPDEFGAAHPSFVHTPATGQLGSENPNAQNIPGEKSQGSANSPTLAALAGRFRDIIEAPSGFKLVEMDYKSFHVLTLGFCAQDPTFMRLARMDMHSYFAAVGLLKIANSDKLLAMPDDALADYLAWVKQEHTLVRSGQAKHAILGYGNGLQSQHMYEQYSDFFSSRAEADSVIRKLDATFPVTAAYRKSIQGVAHDQKYLRSPHGYLRRFWEVSTHKMVKRNYQQQPGEKVFQDRDGNRWKVGHGADAEAALSYFTQNTAHGHLKDAMLAIDDAGYADKYGMCNTVHDALWFWCPDNLVEECVVNVRQEMEKPSKVLVNPAAPDGLWCAVDVTVGQNMRERNKPPIRVAA